MVSAADAARQDLVGRVALVRGPGGVDEHCSYQQRVRNARDRGAAHVLAWDSETQLPPGPTGIRAMACTDIGAGAALTAALVRGTRVTVRVLPPAVRVAPLSSYGPTWELDVKPGVLAPGHEVAAPGLHGGLWLWSGTSVAAPHVAGIFALVGQARKTFDPAVLNAAVVGTARPLGGDGSHLSVAQQGGGLVRAWAAARAPALASRAGLAFNDTARRVGSFSLRIDNAAAKTVDYTLSDVSAVTLYTLQPNGTPSGYNERVQAPARIRLNTTSVTLGPGESAVVDVSASDPDGVDQARLPVWSGWVAVDGSDGSSLSVPYLGLAGSLRNASLFDASRLSLVRADGAEQEPPRFFCDFGLILGSPEVRMYAVPLGVCPPSGANDTSTDPLDASTQCVPQSALVHDDGLASLGQIPGFPRTYVHREDLRPSWGGLLKSDAYAPPGKYKLVARAPSMHGDGAVTADWQTAESPEFTLVYPGNRIAPEGGS